MLAQRGSHSSSISNSKRSYQPPTGFFDLPLELKEQIYEYCLVNVSPAVYIIYKHAGATKWYFRHIPNSWIPPTLLVCKTMRQEVLEVLFRITDGPLLRINPDFALHWWTFEGCLFDKADETQSVFGLELMLLSVRKVKLELNVSSRFAEQACVLALLRWLLAVLNLRALSGRPAEGVSVELTLEHPNLWPKKNDGLWRVLNGLLCGKLSVVCLLRECQGHWERGRIEELCGSRLGSESLVEERVVDAEMARKALFDSCKRKHPSAIPVKEPQRWFRTAKWWPSLRGGL